jgi:hypothetical protein
MAAFDEAMMVKSLPAMPRRTSMAAVEGEAVGSGGVSAAHSALLGDSQSGGQSRR